MSEFLPVILLMFGGFLGGGAYAMREKARPLAVALAVLAVLAIAAGVLRLI